MAFSGVLRLPLLDRPFAMMTEVERRALPRLHMHFALQYSALRNCDTRAESLRIEDEKMLEVNEIGGCSAPGGGSWG